MDFDDDDDFFEDAENMKIFLKAEESKLLGEESKIAAVPNEAKSIFRAAYLPESLILQHMF